MTPRIKFCGFTCAADVHAALALGVDAVGLNLASGPRRISLERASELARLLPPFTTAVGLFVNAGEQEILDAVRGVRLQAVQLHGDEAPELAASLRRRLPVIKAFRIATAADLARVPGYPADAYLLDAAIPGQPGGTGMSWDWSLLAGADLGAPMLLAGGLRSDTVAAAIAATRPWAVDVASSIESFPGRKDAARMAAFVAAVRGG